MDDFFTIFIIANRFPIFRAIMASKYVLLLSNVTTKICVHMCTHVCNGCKEFYIGQTGDKLRNRKTVHEQQIRDPSTRQMPVSKHIYNCCKTQPKFSIFPFYKFQTDDVSARLAKERYFIDVFSPKLNMF